jgi:uncharacterized protein (DUF1015 family)
MAVIKPFRGFRPPRDKVERIAAPPYDVVSVEEAREEASRSPLSFLHVTRPEADLDPGVDPYADEVYRKGAENFERFKKEGLLLQDEREHVYLYRLEMEGRTQTGVVAGVSSDEYERGLIKKHELTRHEKELDRTRHTLAVGANPGPVFLTYVARKEIDDLVEKLTLAEPEYDFTSPDGIRHTFWVVGGEGEVEALAGAFRKVPCLYIADGHHRASVGNIVAKKKREENPSGSGDEPYNFFLAVAFPHDQLRIMEYNRLVRDLGGLSADAFLDRIREKFSVEPSDGSRPARRHGFKMLLGGKWYALEAEPGSFPEDDPVGGLDVSILQENLLGPVLGITDPRKDDRIDFVGGIRGMGELERRCREGWTAAFAFYPMSIEELLKIADAGLLVPPKSTWFEPKLRSGLVVKPLDG